MKTAWLVACGLALSSSANGARADDPPLGTELVVAGLNKPLFVTAPPGDPRRICVVEKTGKIRVVDLVTRAVRATPFADITSRVRVCGSCGILGMAFSPDYASDARVYVRYIREPDYADVLVRYRVNLGTLTADASSGEVIWESARSLAQRYGGWIGFGPHDGMLYVATGDGFFSNDNEPENRSQILENQPQGKVHRIDPNGDAYPGDPLRNYAIVASNPFVGIGGDDEIFDYGLRNPWRCSFDRQTGDLYIGEVGRQAWEEIDYHSAGNPGGLNFGWKCMEGANCSATTPGCVCPSPVDEPALYEWDHTQGCAAIGGYVYRGCAIPELSGTYFFGDYCGGRVRSFRVLHGAVSDFRDRTTELDPPGAARLGQIASFGEDAAGELYICDHEGNEVWKIVRTDGQPGTCLPCRCDWVGDDGLTSQDYFDFLEGFFSGEADFDGNGETDSQDFFGFLECLISGCR